MIASIRRAATRPVAGHSAAAFRIGFGLAAAVVAVRLLAHGWVDDLWLATERRFPWWGLDVSPLPAGAMHGLVVGLVALAGAVVVGWHARPAAALVGAGLGYLELLDRTTYVNHYYWLVLTAFLVAWLPTDRVLAVRPGPGGPWVERWVVWALRGQVGMVYVFAAIAKLDGDWLAGEPMATWLAARTDLPIIGPLLAIPGAGVVAAWAGLVFDATIVLWLSLRAARRFAYVAVVGFHGLTYALFPAIGVFPLAMVAGTLVFLPPDWPARLKAPATGRSRPCCPPGSATSGPAKPVAVVLAAYVVVMGLLPLRHLAIPGDVAWTSEGDTFAWRVMLTERAGWAIFEVTDPVTGRSWLVEGPEGISERQRSVMATDPDLLVQAAHWVAIDHGGAVEVRADAVLSVNGRRSAAWIDPTVDLAAEPLWAVHRSWILGPDDTGFAGG